MACDVERIAADGLTGTIWRFSLVLTHDDVLEVRLRYFGQWEKATPRHKRKVVRMWDGWDERSYHSNVKRRELPDLVPEDVRAEALSKVSIKLVIPEPTERYS